MPSNNMLQILNRPYFIAINTINVMILLMNYLNNVLNESHKNTGQVEPIPEPAPQIGITKYVLSTSYIMMVFKRELLK